MYCDTQTFTSFSNKTTKLYVLYCDNETCKAIKLYEKQPNGAHMQVKYTGLSANIRPKWLVHFGLHLQYIVMFGVYVFLYCVGFLGTVYSEVDHCQSWSNGYVDRILINWCHLTVNVYLKKKFSKRNSNRWRILFSFAEKNTKRSKLICVKKIIDWSLQSS